MCLLAETLRKVGQIDSAHQTIIKSQLIFESLGDTSGINHLKVLMELGSILEANSNYMEAEDILRKSLQLSKQLFDSPHPQISNSISDLATVLKSIGKYSEAESLYMHQKNYTQAITYYNKTLKIRRRVYENPDHSEIANTENSLVKIMVEMGKYGEAEKLFRSVLYSSIKTFGRDHSRVIIPAKNYASVLLKAKQKSFHRFPYCGCRKRNSL